MSESGLRTYCSGRSRLASAVLRALIAVDQVDVLAALQLQMLVLTQVEPASEGQIDLIDVPPDGRVGVSVSRICACNSS